ncbi:MAG: putative Ig domain-containing protein, partial [Hydrogenophaga sp.]|nr:putative Ig domain-containing protein [Hydrogenophaga sp.]
DQAGAHDNIVVEVTDGLRTDRKTFNVTVTQAYPAPVFLPVARQVLREGDRFAMPLQGSVPGGLEQADGTRADLQYLAPYLPIGATLNPDTGWFEWTPGFASAGTHTVEFILNAEWTLPDGSQELSIAKQRVEFEVLNANGAPQFLPAETWQVLEGQMLRVSVFAFDPDNPSFEPQTPYANNGVSEEPLAGSPSVTYDVQGLPEGAVFNDRTMEIVWTPGYTQAGVYAITVTATDDGDGTGTPAVNHLVVPIVVSNANRAPVVGDIANVFVDKNSVVEVPVQAVDADGNPLQLTFHGLPPFTTVTRGTDAAGSATAVLRFAPGEGTRGDYAITVVAADDGDGDATEYLSHAKSFVLTVRSVSEAPVIAAPKQVVAVAGQPLSVSVVVSDLDQDALTWSAQGLPTGAQLVLDPQYGQARLVWTPGAAAVGVYDVLIAVQDSGLPPADAGYTIPENPVPNVVGHNLRIVVRTGNQAPELLGVQIDGETVEVLDGLTTIPLAASEGVPLELRVFGVDADADRLHWTVAGLPPGATMAPSEDGRSVALAWIPSRFAAQDSNTGTPGLWRVQVTASDGVAQFTRTLELTVANVNQTPSILPLPRQ